MSCTKNTDMTNVYFSNKTGDDLWLLKVIFAENPTTDFNTDDSI